MKQEIDVKKLCERFPAAGQYIQFLVCNCDVAVVGKAHVVLQARGHDIDRTLKRSRARRL